MQEDWDVLSTFFPADWRDLAVESGALKGLRKDKSADGLLRVLLMHLGCGHSRPDGHDQVSLARNFLRRRPGCRGDPCGRPSCYPDRLGSIGMGRHKGVPYKPVPTA